MQATGRCLAPPRLTPQVTAAMQMRACLCRDAEVVLAVPDLHPPGYIRNIPREVRQKKLRQLEDMIEDCKKILEAVQTLSSFRVELTLAHGFGKYGRTHKLKQRLRNHMFKILLPKIKPSCAPVSRYPKD